MADLSNSIHVVNGYNKNAYTYYPVIIVGAGESGIALGCRLKEKLGFDQFRMFDRQAGLGGTWWINKYPGVACDVPAVFYSFSFSPNHKWSSTHPGGAEIIHYLQDVCEKYQIVDKIQLNTDVSEVHWLEDEELWEATLLHMMPGTGDLSTKERQRTIAEKGRESVYLNEEKVKAKIICSAAGGLVEPNAWPETIPGRDQFEGDIFHSARWDYNVDLRDKDVIVMGTGCSAAQFVPRLPKEPYNVKSLIQIMRSPPWVQPRGNPLLGLVKKESWEKWTPRLFPKIPGLARAYRTFLFCLSELDFFLILTGKNTAVKTRKKVEAKLVRQMKDVVPEQYHEILTPDYGVGCKRRIFDALWLDSLNDPKIHLTTQPITSLQPKGVTLGPGRTYPDPEDKASKAPTDENHLPADVIILANGFELTTWLSPLKVIGKGGAVMQEVWDERGGPQAYMGNAMDGFPNFFIIFGPNTATGHSSVILASENMVEYTLKFVEKILKKDVKTFDVKKEKEIAWTKEMQEKLKGTVWHSGGCHSWYKTANDWNSVAYPYSQVDYSIRCMFPKWSDWNIQYTTKGLIKQRIKQTLRVVTLFTSIVGLYYIRKDVRGGLRAFGSLMRLRFRFELLRLLRWVEKGVR